jgi:hypothetical protein
VISFDLFLALLISDAHELPQVFFLPSLRLRFTSPTAFSIFLPQTSHGTRTMLTSTKHQSRYGSVCQC